MKDQELRLRLTQKDAKTLWEWFLFQEQNDIHKETSSLQKEEIQLAQRIMIAVMKIQKKKSPGFIYMPTSDAAIAHSWFKALPEPLMDKHDWDLQDVLAAFLDGNK